MADYKLVVTSTGWRESYAIIPRKLASGRWIWFDTYFYRAIVGVDSAGFFSEIERGDIFHVICNPDDAIFPIEALIQ